MLSLSRRFIVPLFVYLSLLLATAVEAHDVPLHPRDHGNIKRLIKKRSPASDDPLFPLPVAGAAGIPTLSSATGSVSSTSTSSSTSSSSSATSSTDTSSSTISSSSASSSATNTSSSATSSSTTSSSVSSTLSTSSAASSSTTTSASLNIIQAPVPTTSTVVPTFTLTTSLADSTPTTSAESAAASPVSGAATDDSSKSKTVTALIAVAASIGGIAILWTVFRKWKLSSSKKFDERLRPIDWQRPTEDDDIIPSHRRHSGASSFRSGPSHSDSGSRAHDPLDHDFTAGASSVGGYADLSRGPSPLPPMQENLARGPSFNRTFDNGVPLHHQAYGGTRY